MTKKDVDRVEVTPELETENTEPTQPQFTIVAENPIPKALATLINNSNRELEQTQARLVREINESASELMELLSLSQQDGWVLDIGGQRFVKVE